MPSYDKVVEATMRAEAQRKKLELRVWEADERLVPLEALARAVIAERHSRFCHREMGKGFLCCCLVAEAEKALGVDHAD